MAVTNKHQNQSDHSDGKLILILGDLWSQACSDDLIDDAFRNFSTKLEHNEHSSESSQ